MVSCCSAKDHKGIEIEKFVSHRSWKKYMDTLRGPTGRSRQVQAERAVEPGAHTFIRVHDWNALAFPGLVWTGQLKPKRIRFR